MADLMWNLMQINVKTLIRRFFRGWGAAQALLRHCRPYLMLFYKQLKMYKSGWAQKSTPSPTEKESINAVRFICYVEFYRMEICYFSEDIYEKSNENRWKLKIIIFEFVIVFLFIFFLHFALDNAIISPPPPTPPFLRTYCAAYIISAWKCEFNLAPTTTTPILRKHVGQTEKVTSNIAYVTATLHHRVQKCIATLINWAKTTHRAVERRRRAQCSLHCLRRKHQVHR